jgi:hypothetical protein
MSPKSHTYSGIAKLANFLNKCERLDRLSESIMLQCRKSGFLIRNCPNQGSGRQ